MKSKTLLYKETIIIHDCYFAHCYTFYVVWGCWRKVEDISIERKYYHDYLAHCYTFFDTKYSLCKEYQWHHTTRFGKEHNMDSSGTLVVPLVHVLFSVLAKSDKLTSCTCYLTSHF